MRQSKGFTIVELLVVIAIIAVLTGIVLSNVTSYINSSKDAAIKGNLSTVLTNGSVYYDDPARGNGSYAGFCGDVGYTIPSLAITAIDNMIQNCNVDVSGTAWCACSTLKSTAGDVFCVDNTGVKKTVSLTDCATECPATGACV